jgi:hypothetical protein
MRIETHLTRRQRRGIVLILVLGMLALLALIGVTFVTFSGQAVIGARNFARARYRPDPAQLMDFALAQLINDTSDPLSAIRGHSLRRDMYGNDARTNGFLAALPDGTPLYLVAARSDPKPTLVQYTQYLTNIPLRDKFTSPTMDFTRWILKLPAHAAFEAPGRPIMPSVPQVAQTFEVLRDDNTGSDPFSQGNYHLLTLSEPDMATSLASTGASLIQPRALSPFVLDGRYLRAFNGPGMTKFAGYGNFRWNGTLLQAPPYLSRFPDLGDPDSVGMDEDYDACDLENWFLAIQSADGHVMIPSFHRPGILTADDWTSSAVTSRAKILRPRQVDHPLSSLAPLLPDPVTGEINYDVDNDGDGLTDAVWLDLGYPAQIDGRGRLFKPLFAFTVIGLNGRMPLNTAGNLQARDTAGNPLWDHVSHLGYSVNEINPKFALQNAPPPGFGQVDNAGIGVDVTQLRNLLTGTRPQNNPYVLDGGNQDSNYVQVGGVPYYLPNNVADRTDAGPKRDTLAVAGRWGEPDLVPQMLPAFYVTPPYLAFNNPVRAGLSSSISGRDATDDDFDTLDYFPSYSRDSSPEFGDTYDRVGEILMPSERIRRFVTPIDPSGNGRVLSWGMTPAGPLDYGTGFDHWGRVGFFHYFRPPGVPGRVMDTDRITAPVIPDLTNNPWHGYESWRDPGGPSAWLMAAMPYDLNGGPPTFSSTINSSSPPQVVNGYPLGSLNRDEADEMKLYSASWNDAPFGLGDLDWLYRKHDTDGSSLFSRLARLAPISFLNPADGWIRSRLFSVETWEPTTFAWANDNPQGLFPNNSRFRPTENASFSQASLNTNQTVPTPSLAHRDRRINLNYPLPVSNDPLEPIRQKWIRETYALFKAVLPPKAIDTPAELAQLSQFVVNIVDFRDPDATMTQFTNPDLNLTQFGMEYCPIALNEVLAYSFLRKVEGAKRGVATNRFFVELINTLTQAGHSSASDLSLSGWDMVILPDSTAGRPDPWTGQIPAGTPVVSLSLPSPLSIPALKGTGVADPDANYVVLGNALSDPSSEMPPMTPTATFPIDPLAASSVPTPRSGAANYYWLYLRRPANPFDPASPRVVVDSFRFPYSEGGGTGQSLSGQDRVTQGTQPLYSVQRLQPYRGGHAVPIDGAAVNPLPPSSSYGYSEQSAPPAGASSNDPAPDVSVTYGLYGQKTITQPIYHTLGKRNDPSDRDWAYFPFHDRDFTSIAELLLVPGCPPGLFTKRFVEDAPPITFSTPLISPPALRAPTPPDAGIPFVPGRPQTFPYLIDQFFYTGTSEIPPPTAPPAVPPRPPYIGGPSGAGWFSILEFVEVPSSAAGAIGPVERSQNFDWYREDLKPGLLNLNLIIDEEVFFGLIDDPRLNLVQLSASQVPRVVTQVDATGSPTASYLLDNRGYLAQDPKTGLSGNALKSAFSDFLKLRHGGSGYLFAFGSGVVGQVPQGPGQGPIARERPFHCLSYPDINDTMLRPATLPPSSTTVPRATPYPPPPPPGPTPYVGDPGLKNPYLSTQTPAQPPPIPFRRLFQIPDSAQGSNASESGQAQINQNIALTSLANSRSNRVNPAFSLGAGIDDRRQHPYFRTEWLQKIMNLTTVRTHQYAVWITVGFFEVVRRGRPDELVPDQLGRELKQEQDRTVRFRSFFILDRTRATGFDPTNPGDSRGVVIYRQRIE